jgi:hypothetical protein
VTGAAFANQTKILISSSNSVLQLFSIQQKIPQSTKKKKKKKAKNESETGGEIHVRLDFT